MKATKIVRFKRPSRKRETGKIEEENMVDYGI